MATVFATHSDLAARWRTLSSAEQSRATALLGDASVKIRNKFPTVDQRIADEQLDAATPKAIACAMVKRVMIAEANEGKSQFSETSGPFTDSATFANPTGDLYFLKSERDELRPPRRAFSIDLAP